MRLDRILTLGLVRPWRELVAAAGPRLPVLMYHSISDDPEPSFSSYYKVCTSPQRFAEQMKWLADAGYRGVTLSEGLKELRKEESDKEQGPGRETDSNRNPNSAFKKQKLVAITFDDGFRDFHTEAFPVLRQHGFTATMYLPTAFIGDERKSFKGRECLTWAEIRGLQDAGIEFGSHTVSHPKLVELDWPQIELELNESKKTIEREVRRPIRSFAYPYAFPQASRDFAARFRTFLREAGYESCATTEIGPMRPGDDPLRTKRYPVNSCDDESLLLAKLAGAYDWMASLQRAAKALKKTSRR